MEGERSEGSEPLPEELLEKLRLKGIEDLADLLHSSWDSLLSLKLSKPSLSAIQSFFESQQPGGLFFRGAGRNRSRKRLPVGQASLDNLLEGGVPSGTVTDFYGRAATGKTQICFQLCISASKNGAGKIIYLDTAGTFRPERITEICENRGLDSERTLNSIYVARPHSVADQTRMVRELHQIFGFEDFDVLLLDTVTQNFLAEFEGESGIIKRQSRLARHLHDLQLLALTKQIPIVLTNSVRSRIVELGSKADIESAGNIVSQSVHVRVLLERRGSLRRAMLESPPSIRPPATFRIAAAGVVS